MRQTIVRATIPVIAAVDPATSATICDVRSRRADHALTPNVAATTIAQTRVCPRTIDGGFWNRLGIPAVTLTSGEIQSSQRAAPSRTVYNSAPWRTVASALVIHTLKTSAPRPTMREPRPAVENQMPAGIASGSTIGVRNRAGELSPPHHI